MSSSILTNLLLTGILLLQAFAIIFRSPRTNNPPRFPLK